MNRGVLLSVLFAASTFGAGVLAFLWPTKSVGFGGKVPAGKLDDILSQIADTKAPFYVPLARTYIQPYPKEDLPKAEKVYNATVIKGMEQGIVALYQKCVHLGCRVPWCDTAQWFECPCHGSKYNRVGEKRDGPAPRGLDRWPVTVDGGSVTVDTSGTPITGPPIGTDTTGQKPEGPHCI
jgi:cytochrome b6-f complex iron-sulfur subunit